MKVDGAIPMVLAGITIKLYSFLFLCSSILIRDERPFLFGTRQYHGRVRLFACLCVSLCFLKPTDHITKSTRRVPTIFTNHFGSDVLSKVEEEEAEEVEVEEEPPKAELTPEAHQNTGGWKGS